MEDEDQTRKSPIPVPPIWPGLGNGEGIPDSRLRRNRESGNPPFPDSVGTGNRGPGTGIGVPRAAEDFPACLPRFHRAPIVPNFELELETKHEGRTRKCPASSCA